MAAANWLNVRLMENDTTLGDNNATDLTDTAPTFPTTDTCGGASELWGLTLTETKVEATGFGVAFEVVGFPSPGTYNYVIDAVRIKVFYTEGPPAEPVTYIRKLVGGFYG